MIERTSEMQRLDTAMSEELCGWLVAGDPARPCVKKPDHKSDHHDAAEKQRQREREKARYWSDPDAARARVRKDSQKPSVRDRRNASRRELYTDPEKRARLRERNMALHRKKHPISDEGFTYVLVSNFRPGHVKIGSAKSEKALNGARSSRLVEARRYLPDAEHVFVYPGGMWLELRYLHRVFKDFRRDGEWFKVTPEAVDEAVRDLYTRLKAHFATGNSKMGMTTDNGRT